MKIRFADVSHLSPFHGFCTGRVAQIIYAIPMYYTICLSYFIIKFYIFDIYAYGEAFNQIIKTRDKHYTYSK